MQNIFVVLQKFNPSNEQIKKITMSLDLSIYDGVWDLNEYDSDNLEEWMKKMGIPWAKRKIGKSLKRTFTFRVEKEKSFTHFYIQSKTKVSNKERNIVIDVAQADVSVEGRDMMSVFTIRDGNLVNVDSWSDDKGNKKEGSYTFTVEGGRLCCAFDYEGQKVLQKYNKV